MGCFGTGGRAVPVFLPDEQVACLFEVLGTVTVQGPFPTTNRGGDTSATMMDGVRSKLGVEAARADADAALVRRLIYDRNRTPSPGEPPLLLAVEGVLLHFVDPACDVDATLGAAVHGIGDPPTTRVGRP
jgi:hypothetical protein